LSAFLRRSYVANFEPTNELRIKQFNFSWLERKSSKAEKLIDADMNQINRAAGQLA